MFVPTRVVKNIVCCQPVHPKPIATTCGHTNWSVYGRFISVTSLSNAAFVAASALVLPRMPAWPGTQQNSILQQLDKSRWWRLKISKLKGWSDLPFFRACKQGKSGRIWLLVMSSSRMPVRAIWKDVASAVKTEASFGRQMEGRKCFI